MYDTMRGQSYGGSYRLKANVSDAEAAQAGYFAPTPNGFIARLSGSGFFGSGVEVVYMAIRRGPLATPTSATEVFDINFASGTDPVVPSAISVVDMAILSARTGTGKHYVPSRLHGGYVKTDSTAAEAGVTSDLWKFDNQNGCGYSRFCFRCKLHILHVETCAGLLRCCCLHGYGKRNDCKP